MLFKKKKAVVEDKPVIVDMRPKPLVIGCENSNRCADYIVMESTLREQIDKMRVERELAIAQKEAYIRLLDKLCPDWRLKATVK